MSSIRTSIRRRLLRWILIGMLAVLALSLLVAVYVARSTANTAYDQAMYAVAADIASQVHTQGAGVALVMPAQFEKTVRTDEIDHLYFSVRDAQGRLIGGDHDLPEARVEVQPAGPSRTGHYRGQLVQVITLRVTESGGPFTVTVAETMNKRDALFHTIITSLLAPMVLLLCVASAAIWLAVQRGLQPLMGLEREIAARNADDLTPIADSQIPEEAASLGHALNRLLTQVQEASARQRRFVADAAHQLRTPLAGMQAETELLREGPQPGALPEHVERLSKTVNRMVRLTSQLLALARSESGAQPQQAWEEFDLAKLVEQGADEWFHLSLARHIDLGFDLSPAPVRGNPGALSELVANLVDNALKYTPEQGEVTVTVVQDGEGVLLRVTDSGPGVPESERERIFERFHRGAASGATQGVGLGLAIVREIAVAHGARITCTEAPKGGARFEVRFSKGEARQVALGKTIG